MKNKKQFDPKGKMPPLEIGRFFFETFREAKKKREQLRQDGFKVKLVKKTHSKRKTGRIRNHSKRKKSMISCRWS